ncbi:hypothetical protein GCM10009527_095180 [Actinomadura nitritigenes]|nr:TetR/AcrR family transcriptional regulator [Actinomadura nitritigenes]
MTSADAASRRRRREEPRKGDLREQAILDAAEEQLGTQSLDGMTVESIARGAGITRNALYFYFASKQDVLAALVRRSLEPIADDAASTAADTAAEPTERIVRAVRNTEHHGIRCLPRSSASGIAATQRSRSRCASPPRWTRRSASSTPTRSTSPC